MQFKKYKNNLLLEKIKKSGAWQKAEKSLNFLVFSIPL